MSDAYVTDGTQWGDIPRSPEGRPRITVNARPQPQQQPQDRSQLGAPLAMPGQPSTPQALPGGQQQPAEDQPMDRAQLGAPLAEPDYSTPRQVSNKEAGIRGLVDSLTFGFSPAIAGLAEASGIPSDVKEEGGVDYNPARPVVGAAKLLEQWLSDHPDPAVVEAYHRGRADFKKQNELAADQHFPAYMAGQLVGALAIPGGAGLKAATAAGRLGKAAMAGGITGSLYGAGEATSEGGDALDVAKGAAKGGATGLALGAAASGLTTGVTAGVKRISSLTKGARKPAEEAADQVAERVALGQQAQAPMTALETRMANEAGVPRVMADAGGGQTASLARRAADTSPTAHHKLNEFANERFYTQNERISGWLRRRIGGGRDAQNFTDTLKSAARRANKPLYDRAYAKGANGVWNSDLERLASAPAVQEAISAAAKRGANRAVSEGYGAFNPKVIFQNGILKIDKGKGLQTFPDLQFWDYTQRELRDAASKAFKAGENEQGGAIRDLQKQLLTALDRAVPDFAKARGTAAAFFKADNALEAGQNFVTEQVSPAAAARVIKSMNPAERKLFEVGFMSEMADKIAGTANSVNIINRAFVSTPEAKLKIVTAIGPKQATEFEALLRVEARVDQLRQYLGGSQTTRNAGHAQSAGHAIGLVEAAKEAELSPKAMLFGMFGASVIKKELHGIDEKVADKVAEMLLSNDPALLQRGIKIVAGHPKLMDALRNATNAAAQVSGRDLGPENVAAGALTAAKNLITSGHVHHGDEHHGNGGDPIADQLNQ